jgi:hypothetical protein
MIITKIKIIIMDFLKNKKPKVKHLNKQIFHVKPKKIKNISIDIEFVLEEISRYRDVYGTYSAERIYIPFNDRNVKITISNIDNSYNELKKHYIDIIEKQKKYINFRSGYFKLNLFIKDIETNEYIVSFGSLYNNYYHIKAILNKLCKNKNGILFDGETYSDNYDDDIIIERINNLVLVFIGSVYPGKKILQKDVLTFVKINAKEFMFKTIILKNKIEEIMIKLKNDLGKDYWDNKL